MHISLSKMGSRQKKRKGSCGSGSSGVKAGGRTNSKQQRIYLAEPHDYFGIRYVLRMQERQRQLAMEGKNWPAQPINQGLESNVKMENGIVPSTRWRAYDLHNKPRGLYSEEDKKLAAAEMNFYKRSAVAVSVPLKQVLANKLKAYCNRLIGGKKTATDGGSCNDSLHKCSENGNVQNNNCHVKKSCFLQHKLLSEQEKETEEERTRRVRFAPETVFCERNEKSPFWTSLLEKQREKSEKKAEEEEALRPRPFLPFLEAGLSYRNDEEFYQLKNNYRASGMHNSTEGSDKKSKDGPCWKFITKAFRKTSKTEGHASVSTASNPGKSFL